MPNESMMYMYSSDEATVQNPHCFYPHNEHIKIMNLHHWIGGKSETC